MNDRIEIKGEASGDDGVNRLVSALDRLDASLGRLAASNESLVRLDRQMKEMQASITTGFAEMRARVEQGGEAVRAAREKSEMQIAAAAERGRDRQLNADRVFVQAKASMNELQLGVDATFNQALAKLDQQRSAQRAIDHDREEQVERQWLAMLEAQREKELGVEATFNQAVAKAEAQRVAQRALDHAREEQVERDWVAMLAAQREKELGIEAAFNQAQARTQAQRAERARSLNTNFITSPLSQQISTAERAQVYASLGGDAAARYGTLAATADLAALRGQYNAMPEAVRRSQGAITAHNDVLREGHALARGFAGSLGGLWLTYGSLVPLVAGAAIAASLKGVVSAGKDVEYQLKFVEALGGGQTNLDSFLRISDQTVVSVREAAEGMRALAQNGLNAKESLAALPSVLNLATIGEMSVSSAALAATGVMSAFGLKVNDLDRVGDIFAKAAASSNTSVTAMTESMKQAATVASIYGVSIEETSAALGTMAKVNIIGGQAGTAMVNMLTSLYAPTDKAKKALHELQVTADDGNGGLKNATQLLGELRGALSRFNDSSQTTFLNDIFTVRGAKGAATIMSNWDEYNKKIEEAKNATGFMGEAVAKLEDSTEGALKHLKNNVQASFVEAFTSAQPALQGVLMQLSEIARRKDTVDILTAMADATMRLVTFSVENAKAIGMVVGALAGLRILASVNVMWREYQVAATAAATASNAAAAATATAATSARLLQSSLGWISLALAGVTIAYELFVDKTTDFEKANQRLQNSVQTNIDYLEREIKALEERNKYWNPETQRFDKKNADLEDGVPAAAQRVLEWQQQVKQLKADLAAGGSDERQLRISTALSTAQKQLADAKSKYYQQEAMQVALQAGRDEEQARKEKASLLDQVDILAKKGELQKASNGEMVAAEANITEKARAAALEAVKLGESIKSGAVSVAQGKIDLLQLTQQYNAALQSRATPINSDALKASLEAEQFKFRLAQLTSQANIASAKSQNARGELGDLQLINRELAEKLDLSEKGVAVARRQMELASAADKQAKTQAFNNKAREALVQGDMARGAAEDARETVLARMQQQELQFEAKTLADKGDLVGAYNKQYEAQYGLVIEKINRDIKDSDNAQYKDRLTGYLKFLEDMKKAGQQEALGKQIAQQFSSELAVLQQRLQSLSMNSGPEAGLGAIFDNALRAEQEYAASLPELIKRQKEMQNLADETGKVGDQRAASSMLKQIEADAQRMRTIWVDVSEGIARGLTSAFGKGGAAMGQMLVALTSYDARQKQIKDSFANSDKGSGAQKKQASDMASAQVKAYGDMAAAASGFFDTNSKGYKVLRTTEQAFRAWELAMAIEALVKKTFFKEAEVAVNATTNAQKIAGETASTAVSTTLAGTEASAWGVTAVVKAIASLPFPFNLAAGAATLAAVVAIGAKLTGGLAGGHADTTAQDRQKALGTGSVLGDPTAKSESVAKSLERIEKYTFQDLEISSNMLAALRGIQSGITGTGSLLARNGVVGTKLPGTQEGTASRLLSSNAGILAVMGPITLVLDKLLGGWVGKTLGKVGNAIFGGNVHMLDTGVLANKTSLAGALAGGLHLSQYTDTKTDGGWFGKDKYNTQLSSLGSAADDQFTRVIASLRSGVLAAAEALGQGGDTFLAKLDSFVIDIPKISTKDMKPEEVQAALEAAISKLGDDMATFAVQGFSEFAKAGEGALETLTRVAADFQAVGTVFESIGISADRVGALSVGARERLVDLSNGIEDFLSQGDFFVKNFFTDVEQANMLRARLNPQLAKFGLSTDGVDAQKAYRDVVVGLDLTTQAGAEAYATLMKLAPAFMTVTDSFKNLAKDRAQLEIDLMNLQGNSAGALALQRRLELEDMDASLRPLKERIYALQDEANALDKARGKSDELMGQIDDAFSALQKVVNREKDRLKKQHDDQVKLIDAQIDTEQKKYDKLKALSDALHSALDQLKAPGQDQIYRQVAQAQLQSTLAIARAGGPLPTADSLKDTLSTLTKDATDQFGSYADYMRDFNQTQNSLNELAKYTDSGKSVAEKTLDTLKKQKESLDKAYEAEVQRLDDIITHAQDQIDELKHQSTLLLSINQALANLASLLASARANPFMSGTSSIYDIYQSALGRAPDSSGLNFWQGQLANGTSIDAITDAIKNSSEAKIRTMYQTMLGRTPDQAGLDFWVQKANSGISLDTIQSAFAGSAEYKTNHPEAVGFQSGSSAMLSQIDYATVWRDIQNSSGSSSDADQKSLAQLQASMGKIATATAATAALLDQVTGGGGYIPTKEMV